MGRRLGVVCCGTDRFRDWFQGGRGHGRELPMSEGCTSAGRGPSTYQKLWSVIGAEAVIAIGIAATALALFFQEPITTKSIAFTSAGAGKSFDAYAYDDGGDQGASTATFSQPMSWTCQLVKKFEWPYCGFGLLFDRAHSGRGLDLTSDSTLRMK